MAAITAGLSASLTGQFSVQGRQARAGLLAWAHDVNQAGGLPVAGKNYYLEAVCYDDASLAEGAVESTRRLVAEDRVDLLFGPYSSGLARAAATEAARHGQLLWNHGGAAEEIHQPGGRVVGILSGASQYLASLPALLLEASPAADSFAILRCSVGAFSRQVSIGLEKTALEHGLTCVLDRQFPPGQSDFSGLAEEALAARPDLLLAVGRIRHDIALARCLVSMAKDRSMPRVVAVVAAPIARFRQALGDNVEGFVGPSQWEPVSTPSQVTGTDPAASYFGPTPAQVMASLQRASQVNGGLPVDYPMAQAYAAGLVAQRSLAAAGALNHGSVPNVDPDLLWKVAGQQDFHTFFGRFRINPETGQQVGRTPFLVQWQQGKKVVIWPPEQSEGKLALGSH